MYCGKIVEEGATEDVIKNPRHPYTKGLIDSVPGLGESVKRFTQIPSSVPHPMDKPRGCYFCDRCERCVDICKESSPPLTEREGGGRIRCFLSEKGGEHDLQS